MGGQQPIRGRPWPQLTNQGPAPVIRWGSPAGAKFKQYLITGNDYLNLIPTLTINIQQHSEAEVEFLVKVTKIVTQSKKYYGVRFLLRK